MVDYEQGTLFTPEPAGDEPNAERDTRYDFTQEQNLELALRTKILIDVAITHAEGVKQEHNDLIRHTRERLEMLLAGNDEAIMDDLATPIPDQPEDPVFKAAEKGTTLAAYLYAKEILQGKTHRAAIQAAETAAVKLCMDYGDAFVPFFVSTKLLDIWQHGEIENVDPRNDFIQQFTKKCRTIVGDIIRTRTPKQFIIPIDKVSNKTFGSELVGKGQQVLKMEKTGSKTPISTTVQIDYENLPGVKVDITGGLTEYDRAVHNAVVSINVAGNEYFSPQTIYQAMTGDTEARLTENQAEAIRHSLDRLTYCKILINAKDEAAQRGWTKATYEGRLIAWEKVTITMNGTVNEGYRLLRTPVLYEYADKKGQIVRVDIRLLKSPINKTPENISLQNFLIRRITAMRGPGRMTPVILYESIYEHLSVSGPSAGAIRFKKNQIREKVERILNHFVSCELIGEWKETTKGQSAYSINIVLDKGQKKIQ